MVHPRSHHPRSHYRCRRGCHRRCCRWCCCCGGRTRRCRCRCRCCYCYCCCCSQLFPRHTGAIQLGNQKPQTPLANPTRPPDQLSPTNRPLDPLVQQLRPPAVPPHAPMRCPVRKRKRWTKDHAAVVPPLQAVSTTQSQQAAELHFWHSMRTLHTV